MPEFTIDLDNDTFNYLEFLERMRFIKNKDEAVKKALLLFKKLSMHDWLPDIYRIADARIILMEDEIYRAGHLTALKRKVMKPEYRDINLTKKKNWLIVLRELENLGWGIFTRDENEIKVEYSAVPNNYLRGYLETMFKVNFMEHHTNVEGLVVFIAGKPKHETWL